MALRQRDTDVAETVGVVRQAFVTAAVAGLVVAGLLSLFLTSTLTRRLARLRDAAVRITTEGMGAPTLMDYAGEGATLAVIDGGPGVPREEQGAIFERFRRGTATRGEGGFGLGLAIGRELAERLDGSLRLEPTRGHGARFVLTLPIELPSGGSKAEL